jgi:hypothetical protein
MECSITCTWGQPLQHIRKAFTKREQLLHAGGQARRNILLGSLQDLLRAGVDSICYG